MDHHAHARHKRQEAVRSGLKRRGYADGGRTDAPQGLDADPAYSEGIEGIVDHDTDGAPIYGRIRNDYEVPLKFDQFRGSSDPYDTAKSKQRDKDFDARGPKKPRDK